MKAKPDYLPQSKLSNICQQLKSWQFLYLLLFTTGLIINLAWNDQQYNSQGWTSLSFQLAALIIKLSLLIFKHKLTFKQFVQMQLDFTIPYVMLVVNLVLAYQPYVAFNHSYFFDSQQFNANWTLIGILYLLNFAVSTIICSLIMNERVKKFEYYFIFCLILVLTAAGLYQNVVTISQINSVADTLTDDQNENLQNFILQKITQEQYNKVYQFLGDVQGTIQNAKDYSLASIASIIAQFLIMLDVITRPQEKKEHKHEIQQALKVHLDNLQAFKVHTRTFKTSREIELSLVSSESQSHRQSLHLELNPKHPQHE